MPVVGLAVTAIDEAEEAEDTADDAGTELEAGAVPVGKAEAVEFDGPDGNSGWLPEEPPAMTGGPGIWYDVGFG